MEELKTNDLTSGNLFKKLLFYSIPIILSGILQLLYNAADLIVCGQFGSLHSTAAISSTNSLINLIINFFLGLSVGSNVLMARCLGENNKEKAHRVAYTAMIYSVSFGLIVGLFGYFTSRFFLELMGTNLEVIDLSSQYLKIYFLGVPFSMIYNFGASLLRGVGDTKRPFIILTLSGVFNVGLNLLFVIAFNMDVPGVALATIISQGISAILIVIILFKNNVFFRLHLKEFRFYKREGLEIVKIGLPAGIQGAIFSFSNVLIQSSINSLGVEVTDGSGASSSLEGFIYTAMNSVAQGCVAFVSANYGAMKKENIKKSVIYSCILVFIMNVITAGLILLFRYPLIHLYVKSDIATEAAIKRLMIISLTYFLCGFMDTFAFAIRGIGYSLTPMIVSLLGACGLRILWIVLFFNNIDSLHNIEGLAMSYPISWFITSAVHLSIFIILYNKRLNFKVEE